MSRAELVSEREAARFVAELTPVLVKLVLSVVRAEQPDEDAAGWVPHTAWPFGTRRRNAEIAKSGAIEGVRQIGQGKGRLYLARRSALEAYIDANTAPIEPRDVPANDQDDPDDPAELLAAMGFEPAPSSAPRRRTGRGSR